MVGTIVRRSLSALSAVLLVCLVAPLTGTAHAAGGDGVDDYSQCKSGSGQVSCTGWTNGILNATNSEYREDQVTPQRLVTNFSTAGSHTIQISYLTVNAGHHAYDSLATWNHTETAANRCQDIIAAFCVGGPVSTTAIPADPTPVNPVGAGISNVTSAHQLPGQHLELYGGTLTGAANQAHGTYAPDYGSLLVTLTTAAADTKVMLLFGGHIGAGLGVRGWGAGKGAGGITGGSYHIRITEGDGTTIGNRDNQLMSGAIMLNDTTIATTAQAAGVVGDPIHDHAVLTGATADASGTITFKLYGPVATNTPTCTTTPVFTSDVAVVGGVTGYDSAPFTVGQPGYYFWVASYSGDPGNNPSTGACGNTGETTHVVRNTPAMYTAATTPVQIGTPISDTAHLTGLIGVPLASQTTFQVYADNACATALTPAPLASTGLVANGNEWVFTSAGYLPTAIGSYYWRAFYAGDALNIGVSGPCQAADETSVVGKRGPAIATQATATAPVGSAVTDTATVTGIYGTLAATEVTFTLYSDSECAAPVLPATTDAATLTQVGATASVTSNSVIPPTAGSYYWRAFYAGNAYNLPVSGECGAANETTTITQRAPGLSTTATPTVVIGSSITDVATITGVYGTLTTAQVTFRLYSDSSCGTQVGPNIGAAPATNVGTTWTVTSGPITPAAVGSYYWRAFYAGDADNAAVSGVCNATGERSDVIKSQPGLTTVATEVAPMLAALIHDTAYITGVSGPLTIGEVTFKVFSSDTCTEPAAANLPAASATQQQDGTWVVVSQSWNAPGAGTYYWRAFYAGNAANEAVSGECNATNEVSTVTKAEPAITTTATGSVPVGGSVQDVAHVTGLFGTPAAGDVTFTVYSDAGCTAAVATVAGVTVSAAGTNAWDVTSAAVPVGSAGTYRWIASYSGDANNVGVAGACGDAGETSTVTKLTPAISTSATGTVEVGGSATDTASLTGILTGTTVTPAQVTFTVYADDSCGTELGTVGGDTATLVGSDWQITSLPFTAAHAGTLYWRAAYAGDANNAPVTGGCSDAGEQTTVTPRSPLISTKTAPSVAAGAAVTDVAYLTGIFGPVAAGDVHFVLYGDSGCTVVEGSTDGVGVTGGNGSWAVTSGAVTPAHAGTYHWIASYLGNADNDPVAGICTDADETVTVTAHQPGLATTATVSAPVGAAVHDVATLTGVFGPVTAGEVHFALYLGADCTGTATAVATASVSSAGSTWTVTSADFVATAAGSYHWIASYDGNGDNDAVTGTCGDAGENTTVTRLAPAIATTATPTVAVGGSIHDTATLSGVYSGTTVLASQVHFALYDDAECANLVTTLGTANLVHVPAGWIATSASYSTTAAGSYRWIASYDGDANNDSVTGNCGDQGEASEVGQRAPGITTVAQTPVTVGSTITDTATLTGVFGPVVPADVTFTVYDNADCTGAGTAVAGATLVTPQSGEIWVIRSTPYATAHALTYYWVASWPGNANNAAVTGACSDPNEQSTATKAQPTIDTAAVQSITVGTDISDTAHVTGVFGPLTASQVTFDLYVGAECPGTFVSTVAADSATLSGGVWVVTSAPFTTTQAGTYHWVAHYAGNTDNAPADGACGDDGETSTVGKAAPAIDTVADTSASIGAAITDTARLTGLATGTTVAPAAVSFAVYSDATCATQVGSVLGATVTTGVGHVFVQSAPFTPAAVGTYYWIATYAGDSNNSSATGACGDAGESTVVTARTPTIATTATAQTGLGGAISDTATLDGLFGSPPQGTVTFTLYATADCSGDSVFTSAGRPLAVGAGGTWTASSGSYTPASAGTYRWIAAYTGDAANGPATGACNDAGETSQVGDLVVVKAVDLTVANYDDLLTYTLTGTAHGLDQHNVVITDVVPVGTTYVSAACVLPCVASYEPRTGRVTWAVGTVTAESSVAVTLVVRIDRPAAGPDGELPATIIDNIGAIRSTETPTKPSNPVVTHVPRVLGVSVVRPLPHPSPARLATTGPSLPLVPAISVALVMLATGLVLTLSGRRRKGNVHPS